MRGQIVFLNPSKQDAVPESIGIELRLKVSLRLTFAGRKDKPIRLKLL